MENFYDMTTVSKKTLENSKRIAAQRDAYLADYDKQLQESATNDKALKESIAMSGARFSNGSSYIKSKNRVAALNEEINYTLNSTVVGMSEMICQIVEGALLLDESELAKIYPEYREDIKSIAADFLKNGNLNESVTDPRTLTIMEYISKRLPSVREGKSLTEAQLCEVVTREKPIHVDSAVRDLSGNVSEQVASLLEKEAKTNAKIEKDLKGEVEELDANNDGNIDISDFSEDEIIDAIRDGDITDEDIKAAIQAGEITQEDADYLISKAGDENYTTESEQQAMADSEAQQGAEGGEEMPQEEVPMDGQEEMPAEDMGAEGGEEIPQEDVPMDGQGAAAPGMTPKKQIQMLPDGTLNINIYEQIQYEIDHIDDEDILNEKLTADNIDKKYDKIINKTAKQNYTGKGWGIGAGVGFLSSGILGSVIGSLIGTNISASKHSAEIEYFKAKCKSDPTCQKIISQMKDILRKGNLTPDEKVQLKSLKKAFGQRLQEIGSQVKIEAKFGKQAALTESKRFGRELPRTGLFESLAVNEAMNQIREGKEYNPDLCMAKAIVYVTITEAMNELGLMNVTSRDYDNIIKSAGGHPDVVRLYEAKKNKGGSAIGQALSGVKKKIKHLGNKIAGTVNSNAEDVANAEDEQSQAETAALNNYGAIKNIIKESVICAQEKPRLNLKDSDDIGERIRQRKLLREQQQLLND